MGNVDHKNSFLKLLKNQRNKKKKKKFDVTFLEYLELVQKNPSIAKLAHTRLYEAITSEGVCKMEDSDPRNYKLFDGEGLKVYKYFSEEFNFFI